ncbi:MAG TPA: FG-GAP-like repeat-containing protein [Pyrinomonadaceae bacterium]|jgi:uncharacterized delta-60 repeat protein|nr:FG-GAP-like repeat-containing protein [Pyrinomonadaceae bacterium]
MSCKHIFPAILLTCLAYTITVNAQSLNLDTGFNPAVTGGSVNAIAVQPDQKIIIGGTFTTVNSFARNKIARLNSDGSLDTSFDPNSAVTTGNSVSSVQVLSDGKLLVSGAFGTTSPGGPIKAVVRLNANGSFDTSLTDFPTAMSGDVRIAKQLPDGKIMLCSGPLRRFNNDGTSDPSFTTAITVNNGSATGTCMDIDLQPDGKLLVGGSITAVNGIPRAGFARLNADGSLDTGFAPAAPANSLSWTLYSILPQPSGRINFFGISSYSNPVHPSQPILGLELFAVNSDGSGQTKYTADSPSGVWAGVPTAGSKTLMVFEYFGTFKLRRYFADGQPDASLSVPNFSGGVRSIAVQADGRILVGGQFGLARLISDAVPSLPAPFDFDGDHKTDISVFRPGDRYWYQHMSSGNYIFTNWGLSTDKLAAGDYDNDGKTDICVFRDGVWYIIRSSDLTYDFRIYGQAGDIPYALDINGDHVTDMVVRRSIGEIGGVVTWRIVYSGNLNTQQNINVAGELPGDIPVVGDFSGDGKADVGFYRNGDWYLKDEIGNDPVRHFLWGLAGDIPVPGDYDNDGRVDLAVYRPSNGVWYAQRSTLGFYAVQWGISTDIPVPGDYDGDNVADIAVYRDGSWYLWQSTAGFGGEAFGLAGDIPIPAQSIYSGSRLPPPPLPVRGLKK